MAPAAGNLRFWTGLLFLRRASVGSDADGHATVGFLWAGDAAGGGGCELSEVFSLPGKPHRNRI